MCALVVSAGLLPRAYAEDLSLPRKEEAGPLIIEPIVITASRIEEPLRDAPLTISVIEGEDLEKREALTVDDALRALPGVDVQRTGTIGEQSGVRLRGSLYNQSLVLMDGVPVNSPFDGYFDFGGLLVENVDRIEVVKGPHSTLYGSEALGGVIQVLTRRGEGTPHFTFLEEGGNLSTFRTLVSGEGSTGSSGFSFSAGRTDTQGNKPIIGRDAFSEDSASGRVDVSIGGSHHLSLIARYSDSMKDIGTDIPLSPILSDGVIKVMKDENQTLKRGFFLSSIGYESPRDLDTTIHARVSVMSSSLDIDNPPDTDQPFPSNVLYTGVDSTRVSGEVQTVYSAGETESFVAGADYNGERTLFSQHDNSDSILSGGTGDVLANISTDLWRYTSALYAQNILRWKGIRLDVGGRADLNSVLKNVAFNPKASIKYTLPWTNTGIRVGWSTGLRLPSLKELYYPVIGNPGLKPERSEGYEAGIKQDFPGGTAEVVGYLVDYRNLIVQTQTSLELQNADRAYVRGIEGTIRRNILRDLSVSVGITGQEALNASMNQPLPLVPKFKCNAAVEYAREDSLFLRVSSNYVGPYEETRFPFPLIGLDGNPVPGENPGYITVNATVGSTVLKGSGAVKSLLLFLKGDNILNRKYAEVGGFPGQPRIIVLGARLTL